MTQKNWHRQYLAALLTDRLDRSAEFETVEFLESTILEPPSGVLELLIHRTIAQLRNVDDAITLIKLIYDSAWSRYAPRVLARIADPDAILRRQPYLNKPFGVMRDMKQHAPYSLKDWWLLGDAAEIQYRGVPPLSGRVTSIDEILPGTSLQKLTVEDVTQVLEHFFAAKHRLYAVGIVTFSGENKPWADTLHRLMLVPVIALADRDVKSCDSLAEAVPAPQWVPLWQISLRADKATNWQVREYHTGRVLHGLGATRIFNIIEVLLALSGLLRDGMALSPLGPEFVRPIAQANFVWDFRPRQFSAADAGYRAEDIRALALGFLERLPGTRRVMVFRSRLAMHFASRAWKTRNSASMASAEDGLYGEVVSVAKLLDQNRFKDVVNYVETSPHRQEPVFQSMLKEANAALDLLGVVNSLPGCVSYRTSSRQRKILCVTHASVPEQTGGYAIRAHGVLTSLRNQGLNIAAVTRPGFPSGVLTETTSVEVDGVRYFRLPDTGVPRSQGEIQHMLSFIRPFREFFAHVGVDVVHVRSTFLIALPALIAARQLGLNVLYEVSGLWELVYQDREGAGQLLKRAPFAELAESLTMRLVDQVVVMNEAVRSIAIDRGVDPARISVAHNAVDTKLFTPLPAPSNDIYTVGYLGSFQDYEGLEELVEAISLLRERNTPIRVLMVGDGLRFRAIKALIARKGLSDSFKLTGRVPHEEVIEYYRRMDVLVYPRRTSGATESITPLKPFEALAMEKPIIVSNVAPLREIVAEDQSRGLIFENGNAEDLASAIEEFMRHPELAERLGRAGREWVIAHRNWDNVVQKFIEAYERLS